MTRMDFTIAGLGGQGSILAGVILGTAAVEHDGKHAVQTQAYSSELRGGFAASWIIISDQPVDFPRVTRPDVLIAQARDAVQRFAGTLGPGGLLIMDSDMISEAPSGIGEVIEVPATSMSRVDLKAPMVANMVMLGAMWRATEIVRRQALEAAICQLVPKARACLNLKAFDCGVRAVPDRI